MTKNWRPEGWKNPHKLNLDKPFSNKGLPEIWNIEPQYSDFEAGADALLNYFLSRGIVSVDELEALNNNG